MHSSSSIFEDVVFDVVFKKGVVYKDGGIKSVTYL